jgi:hypothetical protein
MVSHREMSERFAFMAQGKKSFLLYCDQRGLFDKLPDEYAGRLIKHIFAYVNDENPETDDLVLTMAFEAIKTALKRDLQKYQEFVERQRVNGKSGGRPKKPNESQKTQAFSEKPKKADNDSVSDNENENVKKKNTFPSIEDVKDFFLEKGYSQDTAVKAFEYYSINEWKDGNGKPVKNWKQKMIAVWFKPENLTKKSSTEYATLT